MITLTRDEIKTILKAIDIADPWSQPIGEQPQAAMIALHDRLNAYLLTTPSEG